MESEKIFEPFAKAALFLKEQLIIIEGEYNSEKNPLNKSILKKQMNAFKKVIGSSFRETVDFVPAGVSEMAKKYCDDNSLGDIFEFRWSEQAAFEKKKTKKECKLKYEHKIPVKELINRLKTVKSFDDALSIFMQQEIVWIHKDENKLLPQSDRPNPDEEYKKAGIKVIKNPNPASHFFQKNQRKMREIIAKTYY